MCIMSPVPYSLALSRKTPAIFLKPVLTTLCLLFLFPAMLYAQAVNQINVFPTANLFVHPNSNINLFSDISNSGTIVSYDTALINFYGSVWQNNEGGRLLDESDRGIDGKGGIFIFSDFLQKAQRIRVLNSQPFLGFPNLRIDNASNVTADFGNLHINTNLDFVKGNSNQTIHSFICVIYIIEPF